MGNRVFGRLAAVAAGGVLALTAAAPALAHDQPADGFNAVLHGPHHDRLVDHDNWPDCDTTVKDFLGDNVDPDDFIKPGFDVWVFNIPAGQFDESAAKIASIEFSGGVIDIPGDDYWIGPPANPHLLAVSVPAGWTLLDGDFSVVNSQQAVRVTHTCPGEPGNGNGETPPPTTPPPGNGETPPPGNGETPPPGEEEPGLPVTGMQVGGLVALGVALLAAGAAMMVVRRRGSITDLAEEA